MERMKDLLIDLLNAELEKQPVDHCALEEMIDNQPESYYCPACGNKSLRQYSEKDYSCLHCGVDVIMEMFQMGERK